MLRSARARVLLAVVALGFVFWLRHELVRIDARFFPASRAGVEGLVRYLVGDYAGAARAYGRHYTASPTGLLAEAERALDRGDFVAALSAADRVLAQDREQADARLLRVVALARTRMDGEAIDVLNGALADGPFESRITVFLRVLELAGDLSHLTLEPRPLCLLATIHRYLRLYDPAQGRVALRYAERAIAAGDRPADAYLTIGLVRRFEGRSDRALEAWRRAVEIDGRHAEALRWAAIEYGDRGDLVNEHLMARAAFEAAPDQLRYVRLAGEVILEKLGDPAEAMAVARAALAHRPDNATALLWLGRAHTMLGEAERALEAFEKAAAIEPSAESFDWVGYALRQAQRPAEAIAAHRRALALEPWRRDSHRLLADAYALAGRPRDAIAEYQATFQLGAPTAPELLSLCETYHGAGDYRQAAPCYREVLARDPRNFRAQLALPMVLQGLAPGVTR